MTTRCQKCIRLPALMKGASAGVYPTRFVVALPGQYCDNMARARRAYDEILAASLWENYGSNIGSYYCGNVEGMPHKYIHGTMVS